MSKVALPKNENFGVGPFQKFVRLEVSSSFVLLIATVVALLWANIHYPSYQALWHTELSIHIGSWSLEKSLAHWIDEALMTLFFFMVGLEIKREILVGELASPKKALLPVAGAAGGMLFPAGIYALFNHGSPTAGGWGIPMATDIAFALAVLSILGSRIPLGLKIFLSALAIADDLGAVLVIALFYTQQIAWNFLAGAVFFLILLLVANRLWVRHSLVYVLLGIGLWACVLYSGVHATIAGVLVAMCIPARSRFETDRFIAQVRQHLSHFECEPGGCGFTILLNHKHLDAVRTIEESCHLVETPLQRLEYSLHAGVTYLIIPLFALANAGLNLGGIDFELALTHPVTLGVGLGLFIGKPLGITLCTVLAARAMNIKLMQGLNYLHILGAGCLGGIGFTMSLFITGLSFSDSAFIGFSKFGIIASSLMAALLGLMVLTQAAAKPTSS